MIRCRAAERLVYLGVAVGIHRSDHARDDAAAPATARAG